MLSQQLLLLLFLLLLLVRLVMSLLLLFLLKLQLLLFFPPVVLLCPGPSCVFLSENRETYLHAMLFGFLINQSVLVTQYHSGLPHSGLPQSTCLIATPVLSFSSSQLHVSFTWTLAQACNTWCSSILLQKYGITRPDSMVHCLIAPKLQHRINIQRIDSLLW